MDQIQVNHTPAPPANYDEAAAAWKDARRFFIGGSDVYQLFNIPQYGTGCARFLGYKKTGLPMESGFDKEDEALLNRGHLLEPLVADLYEERTGRKVRRPPMDNFGFGKVRRHPEYPFLGVHTDRTIIRGYGKYSLTGQVEDISETGDLEIKTHGEGMFLRIMRVGLPLGHQLQIQQSMLVNRRTWGSLGMLGVFGGLPLEYADTKADPKIQQDIIREGEQFWNGIEKGTLPPPLPDATDLRCQVCPARQTCRGEAIDAAAVAYVKKQAGTDKTLVPITDIELIQDIKALDLLKEEVKALDYDPPSETAGEPGAIQLLEQKILATFAEMKIDEHSKPYIALPGGGAITCALVPGQFNGLDQARLRTEKPDVWKDYFISNKMTGKMSLRLYKPKPKK